MRVEKEIQWEGTDDRFFWFDEIDVGRGEQIYG